MKKVLSILAIGMILITSCQQEELNIDEYFNLSGKGNKEKSAVVYANLSCELEGGGDGCECVITTSDDDCDMQTECKPSSMFPTYDSVLNVLFTPQEIEYRAANRVRITERELIMALKNDGYPLK